MAFNYSKLLGRMKECGFTQEDVADAICVNKGTLNAKLNNKGNFTAPEMDGICKLLGVSKDEIGAYFFAE
jgi:transcriptional regulator with XRE-family HTH domain